MSNTTRLLPPRWHALFAAALKCEPCAREHLAGYEDLLVEQGVLPVAKQAAAYTPSDLTAIAALPYDGRCWFLGRRHQHWELGRVESGGLYDEGIAQPDERRRSA